MAIAIFERAAFDQSRSIDAAVQAAIASGAAELVSGAAELHQLKTLRDDRFTRPVIEQDAWKKKKPGGAGLF